MTGQFVLIRISITDPNPKSTSITREYIEITIKAERRLQEASLKIKVPISTMDILLQKSWLTNLGNGFIDMGARALIESVFPNANIFETSGYVHRAAYRSTLGSSPQETRIFSQLLERDVAGNLAQAGYHTYESLRNIVDDVPGQSNVPFDDFVPNRAQQNVLNVSEMLSVDLVIIPGCVLTDHAFETFKPVIADAQKNDTPIIFLGAGGGNYLPETRKYVEKAIGGIGSSAVITRDEQAYEYYSESFDFAHSGIDCAFFVDEWHEPRSTDDEYVVVTFDHGEEPDIADGERVIRTNHNPFSAFDPSFSHNFEKENMFVSDSLEDYLFVYANAKEVHADRIHACVPALAYGNAAKFYHETPRKYLFDTILDGDLQEKLCSVDGETLASAKEEQKTALENAVERLIG